MLTLETRVAVEDLMHAYVHCIDEGDYIYC